MRIIWIIALFSFLEATELVMAGPQLHYSREIEPDRVLSVFVLPEQIYTYVQGEDEFGNKKKIDDDAFQKFYAIAKNWITKKLQEEDFRRSGEFSDSNTRFMIYSGSSHYSMDWNDKSEGLPNFERIVCEIYGIESILELMKEQSNNKGTFEP